MFNMGYFLYNTFTATCVLEQNKVIREAHDYVHVCNNNNNLSFTVYKIISIGLKLSYI